MLRLLLESNRKGFHYIQGALPSVVAHSLLVVAAAIGTRHATDAAIDDVERSSVTFLIPMNRVNSPPPREESMQFLREGEKAGSGGFEKKVIDKSSKNEAPVVGTGPEEGKPEEAAEELIPNAIYDTVATAVDVDSMVTRYTDSAAPSYPPRLLELKIEGGAYVQFVVDTTGLADTTSFKVISATHPEFAASVRDALPGMRFHPAILRSKKVRQLVEQPFMFKIVPPAPTATTTSAKP